MISLRILASWRALGTASLLALGLAACSSNSGAPASPISLPTTTPSTALVRAVHGSPDAGPVDIYVYPQGATRPTTASVAAAAYPQITNYLSVPAGSYTVDVLAAGSASTGTAVASESVTLGASTTSTVVVGGTVAAKTLRFINFVEPVETTGQSALIVHHASPYVQNALKGPVSVGVYDASAAAPATANTVFSFSLTPGISGPATSGAVSGGEFFVSPIPTGLPTNLGFAAGPSASATTFTTLVTATTSGLATPLQNKTSAQTTLAADTANAVPSGAHVSIFAIDTTSAAQLIGTLDP